MLSDSPTSKMEDNNTNTKKEPLPEGNTTQTPGTEGGLVNFTLFPDLPIEISRQIWDEAVADLAPRTVEVHFEG